MSSTASNGIQGTSTGTGTETVKDLVHFKFKTDEIFNRNTILNICVTSDLIIEVNYPDNEHVLASVLKSNVSAFVDKIKTVNQNADKYIENLNAIHADLNALTWHRFVVVNYVSLSTVPEESADFLVRLIRDLTLSSLKVTKVIDHFMIFECSDPVIAGRLKMKNSNLIKLNGYNYKVVSFPKPIVCERCAGFGHRAQLCRRSPVCLKCLGKHVVSNCNARRPTIRCLFCLSKGYPFNHAIGHSYCRFVLESLSLRYNKIFPITGPTENQNS